MEDRLDSASNPWVNDASGADTNLPTNATLMGDGQAGDLDGELRVLKSEMRRVTLETITTISPTQLAANTDNWNPTNLSIASVIRVSTDASRNLTGITAPSPAAPRWILLFNVGSFNLVLVHDATSTAANRFYCPDNVNFTLAQGCAVLLWYDTTSSRWRVSQEITRLIPQDLQLTGDISPAQITANTDDYNPTGLSTATVLRLSTDASRNLTGLQGGADGRVIVLMNVGAQDLVLIHDATSTAANRFYCPNNVDLTLRQNTFAILVYDSTSSRWRVAPALTFDTTVPSTQALGDAAATGSAGVAARRDHKHAMPAASVVLETGTWSDVTGSRALDTVYQNTTGKKLRVAFVVTGRTIANGGQAGVDLYVGSANPPTIRISGQRIDVAATSFQHFVSAYGEVPNNWYYTANTSVTLQTLSAWSELQE